MRKKEKTTTFFTLVVSAGHVSAEDPHHGAVLRLHAWEEAGPLSVALPAPPHGWGHFGSGTCRPRHSYNISDVPATAPLSGHGASHGS